MHICERDILRELVLLANTCQQSKRSDEVFTVLFNEAVEAVMLQFEKSVSRLALVPQDTSS